jgi:hypothetical protein
LPIALFALFVAIAVLATAWGRSRLAGLLALGMVAITFAFSYLPKTIGSAVGYGGLLQLRYFMRNPPAAVGSVGTMACLALVALAVGKRAAHPPETGAQAVAKLTPQNQERAEPPAAILPAEEGRAAVWPLVLAGIIAGATTLMKAQIAIVVAPAFVLVLVWQVWRHRLAWRLVALYGIGATLIAGLLAYPTTLGKSGPITITLGALAYTLVHSSGFSMYPEPLRAIAAPLRHLGASGNMLFILSYILLVLIGWWVVVMALALWRARVKGERPFGRSPLASHMALVIAVLSCLVGLGVAQRGTGSMDSWNISLHTLQILWWLTICAAAVPLAAALRRPSWCKPFVVTALSMVVIGALFVAAYGGVTSVRQNSAWSLPAPLFALLQRTASVTPVNAVIVQHFNIRSINWVSAVSGRRVVLERAGDGIGLFSKRTAQLKQDIRVLYGTVDPGDARRAAKLAGADFAILNLRQDHSPGLRAIGTVVMRRGDWQLLRLDLR